MAKITLPTIASGYITNTAFNEAFAAIQSEFNNSVLYRNNPSGEPNEMQNDIDMNSFGIYNASFISADKITIDGVDYLEACKTQADRAESEADRAEDEADRAHDEADRAEAAVGSIDAYTKTETNTLLDTKADKSNTYTKSETYSNVEIDGKLFEKADKADTYTKAETDAEIAAGGGIPEAPVNGKQYARKDANWSEVTGGSGGVSTVADGCIYLNNQTVLSDYTIPTGMNAMSAGTIDFVGTVTVPTGSKYHVIDSTSTGGGTIGSSIWSIKNDGFDDYAFYDGPIEFKPNTTTNYDKDDILISDAGHLYKADRHSYVKDLTINGVTVGKGNSSKNNNTVVGSGSLANNTTGDNNVAVGVLALRDNETGSSNTAVGRYAGLSNKDGFENTYLGNNAGNKMYQDNITQQLVLVLCLKIKAILILQ